MKMSPLLPCFNPANFELGERARMHIALNRTTPASATTWLADLSVTRKYLVVGGGAKAWLGSQAMHAPTWFRRTRRADGCWAARIGNARYLLSEDITSCGTLEFPLGAISNDVLIMTQASAEIALGGVHCDLVMNELCSSPHAALADEDFAPVVVAHHDAYVYRTGAQWRMVCAAADGVSLFSVLLAAATERGGVLLGYDEYLAIDGVGGAAGTQRQG